MDTTDEYIKMCRQLPEDMHSDIIDGDFYYWKLTSHDGIICISYTEIFEDYVVHHPEQWDFLNNKEIVKLYRQDQLQDIIIKKVHYTLNPIEILLRNFCMFSISIPAKQINAASMEQLWLAFVMLELYNKIWNGSEWVKR